MFNVFPMVEYIEYIEYIEFPLREPTREHVLGLEAQVPLGLVRLEVDPQLGGEHHYGHRGRGLTTELSQHLPVVVTCRGGGRDRQREREREREREI